MNTNSIIQNLDGRYVLDASKSQERLWFLQEMYVNQSASYNIGVMLAINGEIDAVKLQQALDKVVIRHESLRTVLGRVNGELKQIVDPQGQLTILQLKLSQEKHCDNDSDFTASLATYGSKQMNQPFDLAGESLVRVSLIQYSSTQHGLMLCLHHSITDGASIKIVISELCQQYQYLNQQASSLGESAHLQYADYAVWDTQWRTSADFKAQQDFWLQRLQGISQELSLPTDKPRPKQSTNEGNSQSILLDLTLSAEVDSYCIERGVTPYQLMLSAYALLLGRYSNSDSFMVATPVANRNHSSLAGISGFVANTLALPIQLDGGISLDEWVDQTQTMVFEALAHSEYPFDQLVAELQAERRLDRPPLCQVMFSVEQIPTLPELARGLSLTAVPLVSTHAKYELALQCQQLNDVWSMAWEYNSDLFTAQTIDNLQQMYQTVLAALVRQGGTKVMYAPLMPQAMQEKMSFDLAQKVSISQQVLLLPMLISRAETSPDAVALTCQDQHWSYAELVALVVKLAAGLQDQGVRPGMRVAVCLPRGIDLVSALLAVMYTGATYIPLDPAYPDSRLHYILEDSQPSMVLAEQSIKNCQLVTFTPAQILQHNHSFEPVIVTRDNIAYLLYTSGSTGKPKGVVVTHGNLSSFLSSVSPHYSMEDWQGVLACSSISFDLSVFELFAPLYNGGRVILVNSILSLMDDFEQEKLHLINSVPSAVIELVKAGRLPSSVKTINLAGEEFSCDLVQQLYKLGVATVNNLYAPSETTTYSTLYPIPSSQKKGRIPIGKPIANACLYVLDDNMQPVPPGARGELFIGGSGVTAGYYNRAELTEKCFVTDIFSRKPDAKMYRTGDIVSYQQEVGLFYHTRQDNQIKLRGIRIELGEIEMALTTDQAISEAVVVCQGVGVNRQLAAYLMLEECEDSETVIQRATRQLALTLPAAMVPSGFDIVNSWPLTPNGKIDRMALSGQLQKLQELKTQPPRDPLEILVLECWNTLLAQPVVSVYSNFFSVGGNSLLAVRVAGLLSQRSERQVQVSDMFLHPTAAEMAEHIAAVDAPSLMQDITALPRIAQPASAEYYGKWLLPATRSQQRLWFLEEMASEPSAVYNIGVMVQINGELDTVKMQQALDSVVVRHESLRTMFGQAEGELVQVVDGEGRLTIETLVLPTTEQAFDVALEAYGTRRMNEPLAMTGQSLAYVALIQGSLQQWGLLLRLHHSITDGTSLEILLRELWQQYYHLNDQDSSLSTIMPLQYGDYANWDQQWRNSRLFKQQEDFWLSTLAGISRELPLPVDKQRPKLQSHNGNTYSYALPESLVQGVTRYCADQTITPYQLMLSAYTLLLGRYSNSESFMVATPVANRRHPLLANVTGFIANTLALPVSLAENLTLGDWVKQIKTTLHSALAHSEYPFDELVTQLEPQRRLDRSPLCQVMFSMQQLPQMSELSQDLSLSLVPLALNYAKYELTLHCNDHSNNAQNQWEMNWEYNTDLYNGQTIDNLQQMFETVLAAIINSQSLKIHDCPLLPSQLLSKINNNLSGMKTEVNEQDKTSLVMPMILSQATKQPQAIALSSGQQNVNYVELVSRVIELAAGLQSKGVKSGMRVGVCLPRETDLVISLLAVMLTGAAYVPLDPTYPASRLHYMLEDAEPSLVLLAPGNILGDIPNYTIADLQGHNNTFMPVTVASTSLAYVLYTSGSTGLPKGTMVTHANVRNLLQWAGGHYTTEDWSGVLAATSVCFDLSVFELFATLYHGGKVILVDNILSLLEQPIDVDVSLINSVPSAVTELVRENKLPAGLLTINLAGEPFTRELAEQIFSQGVKTLYNLYGPSETTTYSTAYRVDLTELDTGIAIGQAIDNTTLYVLDDHMQQRPPGTRGELYIGGCGVSAGYHGKTRLSTQRFIADRFSPQPGAKMYRTGDLVSYREDGVLFYHGRKDNQIKLFGIRIEPGEIEVTLMQDPDVTEAVVVCQGEGVNRQLTAYLSLDESLEQATVVARLTKELPQHLPSAMVPSSYVAIKRWPLTANGKIDRLALAARSVVLQAPSELSSQLIPSPTTPLETLVLECWNTVLPQAVVSVESNFFSHGGNSLLAVRLATLLSQRVERQVRVKDIFLQPTVTLQAKFISVAQHVAAVAQMPTLPRELEPEYTEQAGKWLFPATRSQERLWFLQEISLQWSAVYNIGLMIEIKGKLDTNRLQLALDSVVASHESLRTSLCRVNGELKQVVDPQGSLVIDHIVLPQLGKTLNTTLSEYGTRRMNEPFELTGQPLAKVTLVQHTTQQHGLLFRLHHSITDGGSMEILISQLWQQYNYLGGTGKSIAPPAAIQYPDYAGWDQQWRNSDEFLQQQDFWLQQLEGISQELSLPIDKTRPSVQSYAGKGRSYQLSSQLSQQISRYCHAEGVTPYQLMLSAYTLLLGRYSNSDSFMVATPVANRRHPSLQHMTGFIANTLALPVRIDADLTLAQWVAQMSSTAYEALEHSEYPFDELVNQLCTDRHIARPPLCQVMFSMQQMPPLSELTKELLLEPVTLDLNHARFELTLHCLEQQGQWITNWEYNSALFHDDTPDNLQQMFSTVLAALIKDKETKVSHCPLMPKTMLDEVKQDWHRQLTGGNDTPLLLPMFFDQTEQSPTALALCCGEQQYTYAQLAARVFKLSAGLQSKGVKSGMRVAVCLPRQADLVVSMLAVMQVGATYIPMDPSYPLARLEYMLADAQPSLIVAEQLGQVAKYNDITSYTPAELLVQDTIYQPVTVTSDHLAYILYTSGSTGKPKGVMVKHSALSSFLGAMLCQLQLKENSRWLSTTTACFDISLLEFCGPLIRGDKLLLATDQALEDNRLLVDLINLHHINVLQATPSRWKLLLETSFNPEGPFIAISGGEMLDRNTAAAIVGRGMTLYNAYGPTEATIWSTLKRVDDANQVTIGKPLSNTRTYVLDRYMQPVPFNVEGELFIGGNSIADGYLGKSQETASLFITDPFSTDSTGRLYRTADIVKQQANGELQFIGRNDHQVKFRGFRIELTEIDTALLTTHLISDSVTVIKGEGLLAALVSYVVPVKDQDETILNESLYQHMVDELPNYMIPSRIIILDVMPHTSNGKVDRKTLVNFTDTIACSEARAPANKFESGLIELSQVLLERTDINLNSNIFELGGNSLLVVKLVELIDQQFDVRISIKDIFLSSSLEQIALVISKKKQQEELMQEQNLGDINTDNLTEDELNRLIAELET